jgi:hypothetical protein
MVTLFEYMPQCQVLRAAGQDVPKEIVKLALAGRKNKKRKVEAAAQQVDNEGPQVEAMQGCSS